MGWSRGDFDLLIGFGEFIPINFIGQVEPVVIMFS